jgi:hypothetical protein
MSADGQLPVCTAACQTMPALPIWYHQGWYVYMHHVFSTGGFSVRMITCQVSSSHRCRWSWGQAFSANPAQPEVENFILVAAAGGTDERLHTCCPALTSQYVVVPCHQSFSCIQTQLLM